MAKKFQIIILASVFFASVLLRFYSLGQNPPGLYWDEAAFGYDGYSLMLTGRDHHGKFLPLFFESFGDWKLPVYFYLLIPSVAAFGLTEFAVRFPSAIFGLLTVAVFYLLVKLLTQNQKLAILSALMLSMSSWHIQFSRAGFESVPALFLLICAVLIFYKAIEKSSCRLFFASVLLLALTMYTYHAYRVFSPLFLGGLLFLNWKDISNKAKLIPALLAVFVLVATALISFSFTKQGLSRAISESTFSEADFEKARLDFDQRSKPPFRFLSHHLFKKPLYYGQIGLKNYFDHFSPAFLFLRGDQIGRHSQVDLGQLHLFEAVLIVIALVNLPKIKTKLLKLMVLWLLLSPLPATFVSPSPHAQRTLQMVVPFAFFSGFGLYYLFMTKIKIAKISFVAFMFLTFLIYAHYLFGHYPKKFAPDWQDGNREMVAQVLAHQSSFDKVYITNSHNVPYIYLLFYLSYDPKAYQQSGSANGFDKYSFVDPNAPIFGKGRALYVAPEWQKIDGLLLSEITDYFGRPVYKVWEME